MPIEIVMALTLKTVYDALPLDIYKIIYSKVDSRFADYRKEEAMKKADMRVESETKQVEQQYEAEVKMFVYRGHKLSEDDLMEVKIVFHIDIMYEPTLSSIGFDYVMDFEMLYEEWSDDFKEIGGVRDSFEDFTDFYNLVERQFEQAMKMENMLAYLVDYLRFNEGSIYENETSNRFLSHILEYEALKKCKNNVDQADELCNMAVMYDVGELSRSNYDQFYKEKTEEEYEEEDENEYSEQDVWFYKHSFILS